MNKKRAYCPGCKCEACGEINATAKSLVDEKRKRAQEREKKAAPGKAKREARKQFLIDQARQEDLVAMMMLAKREGGVSVVKLAKEFDLSEGAVRMRIKGIRRRLSVGSYSALEACALVDSLGGRSLSSERFMFRLLDAGALSPGYGREVEIPQHNP